MFKEHAKLIKFLAPIATHIYIYASLYVMNQGVSQCYDNAVLGNGNIILGNYYYIFPLLQFKTDILKNN